MGESRKRSAVRSGGTLLLVLLVFCACSSGGAKSAATGGGAQEASARYAPIGGGDAPPSWAATAPEAAPSGRAAAGRRTAERTAERPSAQPSAQQQPAPQLTGAQIRVEWEALTVERDRCANPRFRRAPARGTLTMQKTVVVSESHPEARRIRAGAMSRRDKGVAVGVVPDKDMEAFVAGLERRGFYQLARPTSSVQHLFDDESARGRVTVLRDGESRTLLSMRGQGLNPSTKAIPPLYSELKQAVIGLRNQTSTLTVIGMGRDPLSR